MILRGDQLAGLGAAPARKTMPELAAELKAALDQVETTAEARAVGVKAYRELEGLLQRLGGWIAASMVRSYLQPSLERLGAALVALPLFDGPVDETWSGVPNGARRAIQDAASSVWALERVVPEGNLDGEDLRTFAQGFADTLRAELRLLGRGAAGVLSGALGGIGEGLGVPWWAIAGGAGLLGLALFGDKLRRFLP